MLTKEFDYELPKELIAKKPAVPKDTSRLMQLKRSNNQIRHHIFRDLPEILSSDYLLVFNNTRVFPARLKALINESECEMLLLAKNSENIWKAMVKPGKKFNKDREVLILGKTGSISAKVVSINPDGTRIIKFNIKEPLEDWVENNGYPPFPPYIKDSKAGMDEYQTIYAKDSGSIAAPTAGLHFTKRVFNELDEKNIDYCFLTLHVGRGTFLPVKAENIEDHKMHTEVYEVTGDTAKKLNNARKSGKKILAVGTTSVRTLEANFRNNTFHEEASETDIFIYPGYEFKAVDSILTNFHLPKSTLLMLVSAFAGQEFIFKAYKEAINKKYRFYSFGDAMLIL
jgi:S-adenosylmethionine:tRNA ribosyltransferase-isomerase